MMIMLRDDPVIEVFDSPDQPPSWIEAIDIENGEYRFCDERGQRYVGVITSPSGLFRQAEFELRPEGRAESKNVFDLLDRAEAIERSERFSNLEALRQHLSRRCTE